MGVANFKEGAAVREGGSSGGGGRQGDTAIGGPADRDRDELRAMIAEVQVLLGEIVERPGWLPDELRELYKSALNAIEVNFDEVDHALSDPEINERLGKAGLLGPPWRLKHAVWERFKGLGGAGKKAAGLVLRVADTIIGSVAVIIPAAEGISEVKEMVEHGIDGMSLVDEARGGPVR